MNTSRSWTDIAQTTKHANCTALYHPGNKSCSTLSRNVLCRRINYKNNKKYHPAVHFQRIQGMPSVRTKGDVFNLARNKSEWCTAASVSSTTETTRCLLISKDNNTQNSSAVKTFLVNSAYQVNAKNAHKNSQVLTRSEKHIQKGTKENVCA